MSKSSRLVVFDCDGVLVDSEPLALEGYRRVFARHGVTLSLDVFLQCIGLKQADVLARIEALTGYMLPASGEAELWPEIEALFAESLRPTVGIESFLARLATPRCVASSSAPERIRSSLRTTGLARFFGEAIFSSTEVPRGKPAPDVFLAAASAFEVSPGQCCVVEDSRAGIQAAVAAGMTAIGFTGASHGGAAQLDLLREAGADVVCRNWEEVAGFLATHGFSIAGEESRGSPPSRSSPS